VLRAFDALFVRLDAWIDRVLPEELNPLAQTGAIANTTFIAAVVSGIVLLVWYSASVRSAYDSVSAMAASPWTARLARSVHRYSSDACMFFVLLHALKLFFQRRFGGARWLAWITGALLVAMLWITGWLGYWLVWDERARQVALGTARALDALPIFADPLSRSFLSDEDVNSLLFFVVFFVHMLIPLGMAIALWLHITRLSRPRFLAPWPMTLCVTGALIAASVARPADLARPAHMNVLPTSFHLDAWYLLPVALTDRLGAGALWALFLVSGLAVWSVPWTLGRGRARVAHVEVARCNACTLCQRDCPYDAIQMAPRTDDRPFAAQAEVDPSKCIGCGICAGSCDSAAIGLVWFDTVRERAKVDRFVDHAVARGERPAVAFVCGESAARDLSIDPADATCQKLPGYRVMRVPCAGWVHPLTIERALRHGAVGVLVVACGSGSQMYREGGRWAHARVDGSREPTLNRSKVDATRVRIVEAYRGDVGRLEREARALLAGVERPTRRRRGALLAFAGLALAGALSAIVLGASRFGYALPPGGGSELVVSFKHPGSIESHCRDRTPEELQKLPPHMRQPRVCERRRAWVRMRAYVDGLRVVDRKYEPKGIWDDGNSLALERIPVSVGPHVVRVELGDTDNDDDWDHVSEKQLEFAARGNRVVTFDKVDGFRWR
jgi:ferredoxin/coenzyme F420-reducing hydrogenase delta subunit